MAGFLESINLYNYQSFWRTKGESQVNHKCGGFLTLLIILFMAVITVIQFSVVAKRNTIVSSMQTQVDFVPPFTNFTTSQNDPNSSPYMIALSLSERIGETAFDFEDLALQASYNGVVSDPLTGIFLLIPISIRMQKCTANHFSTLPGIETNYANWNLNNWYCFPINQTYSIGGNQILGNYWYLSLKVSCNNTSRCQTGQKSLSVDVITLDTSTNPANSTQPLITYLDKKSSIIQSSTSITNYIYIDQNILKTDSSLTPFESFSNLSSLITQTAMNTYSFTSTAPSTQFIIYRSSRTVIYSRSYLKILQGLSFVGGLFTPLSLFFSVFLCMSRYGRLIYEMNLADRCFRDQQTKVITNLDYAGFVKQVLFGLVKSFKQPDWEIQKKRSEYKKTINGMLDVFFLQKRLHFLQKSVSILFQKHQLKGLHLLHSQSKKEADHKRQQYKFREKMLTFFKNNKTRSQRGSEKHQLVIKPNYEMIRKKRIELLQNFYAQEQSSPPKMTIQMEQRLNQKIHEHQQENNRFGSASIFMRESRRRQHEMEYKVQQEHFQFEDQFNEQFEECQMQNQEEIRQSLDHLLLLYQQALQQRGDRRSKKIFDSLDLKMQNKLMRIAEEQQYLSVFTE